VTCDEFECYGYRRVSATLRHQCTEVNNKRLCRLMREQDMQPKRCRRYIITIGSSHAGRFSPFDPRDLQECTPDRRAVQAYSLLAIGDGVVAQIAALLILLTAGVIVTRTTSEAGYNLGQDVLGQAGIRARLSQAGAGAVARGAGAQDQRAGDSDAAPVAGGADTAATFGYCRSDGSVSR